jgi:hypothetical protein
MGPLSKGNFENVAVSNCIFHDCNGGGIKLGSYEGGEIKNCVFSNIVMENCSMPIGLFIERWTNIGNRNNDESLMPAGSIHDIMFDNIRANAANYPVNEPFENKFINKNERGSPSSNFTFFFHGHPEQDIYNIHLNNISVHFEGGGIEEYSKRRDIVDMGDFSVKDFGYWTDSKYCWGITPSYGLYARHLRNVYFNQVFFYLDNEDLRPPVYCDQCKNIEFNNLHAEVLDSVPVAVVRRSDNITFLNSSANKDVNCILEENT